MIIERVSIFTTDIANYLIDMESETGLEVKVSVSVALQALIGEIDTEFVRSG